MEMEKKDLRRFYAEKRKSIPAEQRQSFDRAIRQNLRELLSKKKINRYFPGVRLQK